MKGVHNITQFSSPPEIKGLDFSREEKNKAIKDKKLLMLTLLTDMKCNFRCPYCFTNGYDKRIKNSLGVEEYDCLFEQAIELGVKSIWWVGIGEPMMYKEKYSLLKRINRFGLTPLMFTNGSLVTEDEAKRLYDNNVSVYVKLNSFNNVVQDSMVGNIKGASYNMRRGLENLLNAGYANGDSNNLAIQSVITKKNIHDIPNLYRWAREKNIIPFFEIIVFNGDHIFESAKEYDLDKVEMKEIFEKLLEIDEKEYGYTWIPTPPYIGKQCDKYKYSLTVDPEGNVLSCAATRDVVGSIRRKSLGEIWNDPFLDKIRNIEQHISGKCADCKIQCTGCRAEVYAKTGSLFNSYDRCWM